MTSRQPDPEQRRRSGIAPHLAGVSETMLWSLHNRAAEARRPDGVLVDPDCVGIHDAIDYDFTRQFGDPQGLLAARAAEIDHVLRSWLQRHPEGIVVSLGEGLETQVRRVDNGRLRWLSVDLAPAIRLREQFLPPTPRFRHLAASALDPAWMDAVDATAGVFVVAQGLLMYLEPEGVRRLLVGVAERFPGAQMVFDTVPRWFSHLTLLGLNQTSSYRLPPMPWGIDRHEIEATLRDWRLRVADVAFLPHRSPRGMSSLLAEMASLMPMARHAVPVLAHVTIASATPGMAYELRDARSRPDLDASPASRKPEMTLSSDDTSHADTMGDVMSAAARNARRRDDIAEAARRVVAKRVAIGIAAAFDPLGADHVELARIVPEKVEAFSTAGLAVLKQSTQANRQMMRFASDEVMATARAAREMSACGGPAALAEAQSRLAREWFGRATSNFFTMGMLALTAQAAAMAPIHQTVVDNAERLAE